MPRNQSCSFSLDSPDLNDLTFLFLNFPCGAIEIEHPVFSLMRVKNLLMKGPVQILSLFVNEPNQGGKRMLGSLAKQVGPAGEDGLTTLGNRKPRVSAIFCQLYLRGRSKAL